jgi:hypothetical protein
MSDESVESMLNRMETHEPGIDYTPMPTVGPEPKKPKEFSAEVEGLTAAAEEVMKSREERGAAPQDEPTDRSWQWLQGEKQGQPMDPKYTLTEDQAADSLIAARTQDVNAKYPGIDEMAAKIDAARKEYQQGPNPPQLEEPQPVEAQQPEQQQPEQIDGVHPDVVAALQNEHVRNALSAEVQQAEQARQAYQQATLQAAQLSAASLFSFAPELANMSAQELPGALRLISQQSPERAAAINAHIQRTSNLYQASQQAAAQQQQLQNQQMERWAETQDQQFESTIAKENPETIRQVKNSVAEVLETEYGIDKDTLRQLYQTQPFLRQASTQRLLFDLTKAKLAERSIATKLDRSVPPVQHHGTSSGVRGGDDGVAAALARFNANPTPQNGAALLGARRASRR